MNGRVTKRSRGHGGEPIGVAHNNSLSDTREYDVEFIDGSIKKCAANIIADKMFAQVNDEDREQLITKEIVDHKKDHTAIPILEDKLRSYNWNEILKITTRGWKLLVEWKYGQTSWIKLKELKESNPIEVAEYAVANFIVEEPAFKWWVSWTVRKRNIVISKLKGKYWRTTHKFSIRLPKDVKEALDINRITGTDFWRKAVNKEISEVKVAWKADKKFTPEQIRSHKTNEYIGLQKIGCHLIFDIKMDFTRKARFVAGGHTTEAPAAITYSSAVSRDSVRLPFMIVALNGLDIMSCDLENAYIKATNCEKIWFEGGIECGEYKGKVLVVVRSLYGIKSAGLAWRSALVEALVQLGFKLTRSDTDVWIRASVRLDSGKYYEMLFVYVDDILAFSHKATEVITEITSFYKAKEGSIKPPDIYLSTNIDKI